MYCAYSLPCATVPLLPLVQPATSPQMNPGVEAGPDLSFLQKQAWSWLVEVVLIQVKYVEPSVLKCIQNVWLR